MVDDCTSFHLVVDGDTCAAIADDAGVSVDEIGLWNPSVGDDCSGLWLGYYVCVGVGTSSSSSTSSTTTTSTTLSTTTTSTGNGVSTPTPYQSGMVDDCDEFHLVVDGDGCAAIADDAGITLDEFYEWNPTVGSDCAGLWLGYYVCVGVL
jgi:hypothetical protein